MDPVVAAFGTALVGAIATDTWQQVREAVTGLWRRVYPRREDDGIEAELDDLREQVLAARRDRDVGTELALVGAWQLRLAQLADQFLAGTLAAADQGPGYAPVPVRLIAAQNSASILIFSSSRRCAVALSGRDLHS